MKNNLYHEKYVLRKRIFTLEKQGVRAVTSSFFEDNEIFYPIEDIGPYIQYNKPPLLPGLITSIVMLVIGVKILLNATTDDFAFVVATSLIGGSTYWLISTLLNLDHIGAYYFSYTTRKDKMALEIKSPYPASPELKHFLSDIVQLQTDKQIDLLIDNIIAASKYPNLVNRAKGIQKNYDLSITKYTHIINRIKLRLEELRSDPSNPLEAQ